MTERKGLLAIVQKEDFDSVKKKALKDNHFFNNLLDRVLDENPCIAKTVSLIATQSKDLQQVMKTVLYVYAFLENANMRQYAFSNPKYVKLPVVSENCLSEAGREFRDGFEIEMIERLREDNPIIYNFVDTTLTYGVDPGSTLKAATLCYRLLELAAKEQFTKSNCFN